MRTNYVTNPSIETATTGWYRTDTCVGTAAITRVAGGEVGDYALQFAYTAEETDATGTATQYCLPTAVGTAAQGDKWTVSAYVKKGAGTTSGVTVTLRIAYYNEAGAYIGQVSGADIFSSLTTSFQRFSYTGTLPADGAISRVAAALVCSSIAYGDAFDLVSDAWLLEKVDALDDYFDGATTDTDDWDYEWAGTAHASLSTATPALYAPELVAYQSGLNIVVEWTQGPEYIDVSAAPYSIDKTGATSVTAALDGSDGVLATIRDAGGIAYFPAGTYLLSTALTVPDGCKLAGPLGGGMTTAWLQGQVVFGSTSSFNDLKIGPSSAGLAGLKNVDGANGTSFTRVHFRGGGAASDSSNSSTVNLGNGRDLANLTFTDCEFERSLGTLWSGSADNTHRENTVTLYAMSNTIDTVTFDGCHIGVTNGVAAGSQRMGVEVWTAHGAGNWWKDITFTDCEFEVSGAQTLDFACYGDSTQGDGVLVEGCTIHGAGVDTKGTAWGQAICLEWPKNIVIRNNTFYRCTEGAIYPNYTGFSYDQNLEVTGNTFDFDTAEGGIVADGSTGMFVTHGANGTITGNTFIWHGEDNILGCVWFQGENSTGNTVTGNTFNVSLTQTIGRNLGGAANNGEPWTSTNTVNRS